MAVSLGVLGAAGLQGCISVLPKSAPVQLYSFGVAPNAVAADATSSGLAAPGPGVGVLLAGIDFPRAAAGDGILTLGGSESAYIGGTRWVSPAAVLFREAVNRAFDRAGPGVRLIERGELGRAGLVLRLEVRDFEAVYPGGLGSAQTTGRRGRKAAAIDQPQGVPTVIVSIRATLSRADGQPVALKVFEVRRSAGDNRVGAMVQVFDRSTVQALGDIVAWTQAAAAASPDLNEPAGGARAQTTTTTSTSTSTSTTRVRPGS